MTEPYQIVEYSSTAAALAELRSRYAAPFDVATPKGMALAKEARAEVRGYRTALETLRKEIKAPALERCRLIDDEAKRITAELLKIEEPIDQQIKAEEQRREAEKAAKARAETARISGIRNRVSAVANQPAAAIRAEWTQVQALELAPADFEEFMPDAITALNETRTALATVLLERVAYEEEQARLQAEREAEEARLKAEREELARLREAEAARQAEQARIAAAARQAEDARLKAERERQEAELRAQREAQQRTEREARQAREAEEARIRQERETMDRQRAELYAQQRAFAEAERQRAEREAQTAKAKAKARKGKAPADPLADLKQALNAGDITPENALDQAYQIGFTAGLQSAQQAA
jgi:colicin import membrane protein